MPQLFLGAEDWDTNSSLHRVMLSLRPTWAPMGAVSWAWWDILVIPALGRPREEELNLEARLCLMKQN
jgi:hypothetical protein